MSELKIQADLIKAAHNDVELIAYRGMLTHAKNNSKNKIDGNRNKALGVVAGNPDLTFSVLQPRLLYGSLKIEMKKPEEIANFERIIKAVAEGTPIAKSYEHEENQARYHIKLRKHGNKVVVCSSVEEGLKEIKIYLNE